MLEKLKRLFLELYQEKANLLEQELLQVKKCLSKITLKEIIEIAVKNDFLPIIKCFVESGYSPCFIIENEIAGFNETRNILNVAAEENSLEVINYLLNKEVFTVDQRASENSITAFHSAIENENLGAAELLLTKGADVNAQYFWYNINCSILQSIFRGNCKVEVVEFLVKHGINIPDNLEQICPDDLAQKHSSKREIKNFLLSIKKLENLYKNFDNAYKNSSPEIQEAWDTRISQEDSCTKILGTISSVDHHAI